MPDVTDQLRIYGEALERVASDAGPRVPLPNHPMRRRPAKSVVTVGALALVAAAVVAFLMPADRDNPVSVAADGKDMVFAERTESVMLFTDGLDGVVAVDLDRRVATRRVIEGERAGDQPFRLTLTGDTLVVGWDEIYAAPLGGGPSRPIDRATIYLPAAEPGEVWTLEYPGGRIGDGSPTLRRVNTAGKVALSYPNFPVSTAWPLMGVPGGLAVARPEGLAIWDAKTGAIGASHPPANPVSAASNGRQVVWCSDPCTALGILDLATTGPPTPQHVSVASDPVFSPDGRKVAYITSGSNGRSLVIRDMTNAQETTVADDLTAFIEFQWSSDGRQLFTAGNSGSQDHTELGRYDVASGSYEETTAPIGGAFRFIVIPRSAAAAFLSDQLVSVTDCAPPSGDPSGRAGSCAYRF